MTTLGEGLLGGVVTLFSLGATQTPAPLKPSGGNPPLLVRWLKTSIVGKDRHISFAVQLHHFGLCPWWWFQCGPAEPDLEEARHNSARYLSVSVPDYWHVCTLGQVADDVECQVDSKQRKMDVWELQTQRHFPFTRGQTALREPTGKVQTLGMIGIGEDRNDLLSSFCWWKCHHHCGYQAYLPH